MKKMIMILTAFASLGALTACNLKVQTTIQENELPEIAEVHEESSTETDTQTTPVSTVTETVTKAAAAATTAAAGNINAETTASTMTETAPFIEDLPADAKVMKQIAKLKGTWYLNSDKNAAYFTFTDDGKFTAYNRNGMKDVEGTVSMDKVQTADDPDAYIYCFFLKDKDGMGFASLQAPDPDSDEEVEFLHEPIRCDYVFTKTTVENPDHNWQKFYTHNCLRYLKHFDKMLDADVSYDESITLAEDPRYRKVIGYQSEIDFNEDDTTEYLRDNIDWIFAADIREKYLTMFDGRDPLYKDGPDGLYVRPLNRTYELVWSEDDPVISDVELDSFTAEVRRTGPDGEKTYKLYFYTDNPVRFNPGGYRLWKMEEVK